MGGGYEKVGRHCGGRANNGGNEYLNSLCYSLIQCIYVHLAPRHLQTPTCTTIFLVYFNTLQVSSWPIPRDRN